MKSQYYQKLARDVDDLYRDISKNDAVANIKKFYGMLKSFLARKLSEMDDLGEWKFCKVIIRDIRRGGAPLSLLIMGSREGGRNKQVAPHYAYLHLYDDGHSCLPWARPDFFDPYLFIFTSSCLEGGAGLGCFLVGGGERAGGCPTGANSGGWDDGQGETNDSLNLYFTIFGAWDGA